VKLVLVAKFSCVAKLAKSFGFRLLPPKLLASFATFAALARFAMGQFCRLSTSLVETCRLVDPRCHLFQLVKVTTASNIATSFASNLT
jgi:hypothetical protein